MKNHIEDLLKREKESFEKVEKAQEVVEKMINGLRIIEDELSAEVFKYRTRIKCLEDMLKEEK